MGGTYEARQTRISTDTTNWYPEFSLPTRPNTPSTKKETQCLPRQGCEHSQIPIDRLNWDINTLSWEGLADRISQQPTKPTPLTHTSWPSTIAPVPQWVYSHHPIEVRNLQMSKVKQFWPME